MSKSLAKLEQLDKKRGQTTEFQCGQLLHHTEQFALNTMATVQQHYRKCEQKLNYLCDKHPKQHFPFNPASQKTSDKLASNHLHPTSSGITLPNNPKRPLSTRQLSTRQFRDKGNKRKRKTRPDLLTKRLRSREMVVLYATLTSARTARRSQRPFLPCRRLVLRRP